MIKQCRHCGGNFEVDASNQHERRMEYCSQRCRNRAHKERKKLGPVEFDKICLECGKAYKAKRCDSVTCSPECNTERNKRRSREQGAVYREKMRAERLMLKAQPKPKPIETIDEIQAKAKAMGMSYGKYLAYVQMQKGALK